MKHPLLWVTAEAAAHAQMACILPGSRRERPAVTAMTQTATSTAPAAAAPMANHVVE